MALAHDIYDRQRDAMWRGNATYPVMSTVVSGLRPVVDTGGVYATAIALTQNDSGKIYLLDDAAGLAFTLPEITADNIGMHFEFRLITEVTSNAYSVTAGATTDLFVGHVVIIDKDTAEDTATAGFIVLRPDVSDDDALTISGSADTSGALVGGWLRFEAVTASRWFVSGSLVGDGDFVTVFA